MKKLFSSMLLAPLGLALLISPLGFSQIGNVKTVVLNKSRSAQPASQKTRPGQNSGYNLSGIDFKGEQCGSGIIHDHLMANDPKYKADFEKMNKQTRKLITSWKSGAKTPPPVYTLPVVIHVIHKGEAVGTGSNISDAQVQSAVDAMTRDFRRNADDGGIAQGAGVDTEIQFCLATQDPSGNPHSGINRVNGTSVSGYSQDGITSNNEGSVKNLSKWPTADYINIWAVAEINGNNADQTPFWGGTIGYAYNPGSNPSFNPNDGIVIIHIACGNDPNSSNGYNLWSASKLGRALTHEMGHHLNLSHTFQGGCNPGSPCTSTGDFCCDTPPATQVSIQSCGSCSSCCPNQQIANYMDYTPEACEDMFTQDQTDRMRVALAGPRNSLLSSPGCTPSFTLDAGIAVVVDPDGGVCSTTITPVVTLQNFGSTTITSVDINYDIDGANAQVYNWTGSLTSNQTQNVTLNTMTTTGGSHTFNASTSNPNGSTDQNTMNDAQSSSFSVGTNALTLTVVLDNYGSDNTWEIKDGSGATVATGGPYQDGQANTTITESVCVADGCFDFIFTDSYGDGMSVGGNGSYTFTEDASGTTLASGWSTAAGPANTPIDETTNFCVPATPQPPVTDFVGNPTITTVGGTVAFTDLSTGSPTSWAWDFGDGNTATTQNPSNTYNAAGLYTVSLTATNANGSDTEIKVDYIQVDSAQAPVADFIGNPTVTTVGGTVAFTDLSTNSPTSWSWDFGDGNTATTQNPSNTYNAVGLYTVSLTATNANGSDTETKVDYIQVDSVSTGSTCDTLRLPLTGTPTLYVTSGTQSSGYVSGNNSYLDISKADYFDSYAPNTTITGALIGFGAATAVSGTSTVSVTVWDNSGTAGEPGTIIGTETVLINDIINDIANIQFTSVTFSSPITIPGPFYLGTQLSLTAGDTVAVITNTVGDVNVNTAWEQWDDNTWHAYDKTESWQVSLNHSIHPVVCENVSGACPPINLATSSTGPSCGASDGTASVTPTGGAAPYTYAWSGGQSTQTVTNLGGGTYTVTATDDNGCSSSTSITLTSPSAPTVTTSAQNASCGATDGSATASVSGGTSPFTYLWSGGQTGATVSNLGAGIYTVTVTDASGCDVTQSITVQANGSMTASSSSNDASCLTSCDGTGTVNASNGTSPYTYAWSTGGSAAVENGLCVGNTTVTITDAAGCIQIETVTVSASQSMTLSSTATNATCGNANGTATITPSGGTSPYTYNWSNGGSSQTESNLAAGTYTVNVTDNGGCTDTVSVTVSNQGGVTAGVTPDQTICNGSTEFLAASGGTGYLWSTGETTISIQVLPTTTTTYTVTVSDTYGCTDVATTTITVNQPPTTSLIASPDSAVCPGDPVTLTASGGSAYVWNIPGSDSSATQVVYPTQYTTYSATAYNGNCQGNATTVNVSVILPAPYANAGSNVTITYISQGGSVTFYADSSIGTFFEWDVNGDGFIDYSSSTSTPIDHNYTAAGTYNAILYVTLGSCTSADTVVIVVENVAGINEDGDSGLEFVVFPNPNKGTFTVKVENGKWKMENAQLRILNVLGETIYSSTMNRQLSTVNIDLSQKSSGIYYLQVITDKEIAVRKVVVEGK